MLVNADFSRWAVVRPSEYQWIASPQAGVERVMLDRVGDEEARATSVVRYAAGSIFPRHQHPLGEEIFVLSGTFSEQGMDYPAGSYLRNPPGSSHCPSSREGAVIFVKLRQMKLSETGVVRIDTTHPKSWQRRQDGEICRLFSNDTEHVCLRRLGASEVAYADATESVELLVLEGEVVIGAQSYDRGTWVRAPQGACPVIAAGSMGATFYMKTCSAVEGTVGP